MSDREPQYFCIKSLEGKRVEGVHVHPLAINLLICRDFVRECCCFGGETVNVSGEGSGVELISLAASLLANYFLVGREEKNGKKKERKKKKLFRKEKNGGSAAKYRLLTIPANYAG